MADKIKEQVKYDPELSPEKRLRTARNSDGTLRVLIITKIFFLGFAFFLIGVWALFPIYNNLFGKDDSDFGVIMSGVYVLMFAFICSCMSNVNLDPNLIKNIRAANKGGCSCIGELYAVMPVTRLTVRRIGFNAFVLWTVVPVTLFMLIMNIYSIVFSGFEPILGCVGGIDLIVNAMLIILFFVNFGIKRFSNKTSQIKGIVLAFGYIGFMWLPLFDPLGKFFRNSDFFRSIAGIPGLVVSAASVTFIICREKLFYQKKLENAPWFE